MPPRKNNFLDPIELERSFEEIKISVPQKKEGQHLEIEELQRLRKLQFEKKDESLERDRDLFLFQVYTGFYYNDLQILRKVQVHTDVEHGQYIISERDKNDNPTIVQLLSSHMQRKLLNDTRIMIQTILCFLRQVFLSKYRCITAI